MKMYTISKKFSFSASHALLGLPKEHPCSRLHGHNYTVIVELQGVVLNETGFIYDYRGLDVVKKYLDDVCDHRHLNDVFDFNPTAENLAKKFYEIFEGLLKDSLGKSWVNAVIVQETDKTSARYEV